MVIPWCPKTPADHILGTHNGAFGYACSHGIACHTTISIIWHTKKFNLVKWGVELKMNWLNWSIPISWGFQFQFKIFQFNSNSIHAELNWIDYQFQFNSWIDPSPAYDVTHEVQVMDPFVARERRYRSSHNRLLYSLSARTGVPLQCPGCRRPPRGVDSWEPYASACSIPAMNQAGLLPTSQYNINSVRSTDILLFR